MNADALELLKANRNILGDYDASKVSGLEPQWFWDRRVDLIDFRGDLQIRSNLNCSFGFRVRILTASHDFSTGYLGEHVNKHVWIDPNTFIGSFALLYNCHIQEGAVVACGAVVRNMVVPAHTMVAGNPARVIKIWRDDKWMKVGSE
jgi:hypothetical protein